MGQIFQQTGIVVQARDKQGSHLHHHSGLLHAYERLFHRLEPGAAIRLVKIIGKRFEIHIGSIQKGCHHVKCLRGHVPVGHKYVPDPALICQAGSVIGEFKIDGRFRIGIGDTPAPRLFSRGHNLCRRQVLPHYHSIPVCRHLRYIGILTEITPEIAANGGN